MVFNYKIQLMKVLVFIGLRNTFPRVKRYVMEPNVFMGYLKSGIACLMSPSRDEQHPFNSMDQNNLAHGVTM